MPSIVLSHHFFRVLRDRNYPHRDNTSITVLYHYIVEMFTPAVHQIKRWFLLPIQIRLEDWMLHNF